jgi:hypothetical protein
MERGDQLLPQESLKRKIPTQFLKTFPKTRQQQLILITMALLYKGTLSEIIRITLASDGRMCQDTSLMLIRLRALEILSLEPLSLMARRGSAISMKKKGRDSETLSLPPITREHQYRTHSPPRKRDNGSVNFRSKKSLK